MGIHNIKDVPEAEVSPYSLGLVRVMSSEKPFTERHKAVPLIIVTLLWDLNLLLPEKPIHFKNGKGFKSLGNGFTTSKPPLNSSIK